MIHITKYLKTRQMHWGLILSSGSQPSMIEHYDHDLFKLHMERPGGEPTVADLREVLKEMTDRLASERQCIMVISDDDKMLTAAKRQDMIVCAYEGQRTFDGYYAHRISNLFDLQAEVCNP